MTLKVGPGCKSAEGTQIVAAIAVNVDADNLVEGGLSDADIVDVSSEISSDYQSATENAASSKSESQADDVTKIVAESSDEEIQCLEEEVAEPSGTKIAAEKVSGWLHDEDNSGDNLADMLEDTKLLADSLLVRLMGDEADDKDVTEIAPDDELDEPDSPTEADSDDMDLEEDILHFDDATRILPFSLLDDLSVINSDQVDVISSTRIVPLDSEVTSAVGVFTDDKAEVVKDTKIVSGFISVKSELRRLRKLKMVGEYLRKLYGDRVNQTNNPDCYV